MAYPQACSFIYKKGHSFHFLYVYTIRFATSGIYLLFSSAHRKSLIKYIEFLRIALNSNLNVK